METITPFFSIDLAKNGGVFTPKNIEELVYWVETENAFWTFYTNANDGSNHFNLVTKFVGTLTSIKNLTDQIKAYVAPQYAAQLKSHLTQCENQIRSLYLADNFPHSNSVLAKRVKTISEQNPFQAVAYLFVFLKGSENKQFNSPKQEAWAGYLSAINEKYETGTSASKTLAAAKSSWGNFQEKAETNLGANLAKFTSLSNDWVQLNDALNSDAKQRHEDFESAKKNHEEAFKQMLDGHQAKMLQLQANYKEDMSLRAPVAYWEAKQMKHENTSQILGLLVFMSLAALGFGAYSLVDIFEVRKSFTNPQLALYGVVVLAAVWSIRLVIRMFLSNTHLASDAAERVTMAKTYLSLAEAEKAIPDEDRKLILQSLFRPGTDGLVKDEGIPHPALEALTKLGGK